MTYDPKNPNTWGAVHPLTIIGYLAMVGLAFVGVAYNIYLAFV
jgi:hypothetical protein